ncbi:hypothetical protein CI105_02260 [Candidatus Izimaplasma bacterium ZiA1]|nr:hypothetical protein CI105_02260 [Candidatus Izimaplasma bacterium ZiA1]
MPAFTININDGSHYYTFSIQLGSWEDDDFTSTISLIEVEETRLTIPYENLIDEYDASCNFIISRITIM